MKITDLKSGRKTEEALQNLDKEQLIHLIVWGIDYNSLCVAINNNRCRECISIKYQMGIKD